VGEGSGQPTDPQHRSTSAQLSNEEPITILSSSQLKKTHKPRKAKRTTKISQSSGPIYIVTDETVYKEWEDKMERATTIASSLEAEQDNGGHTPRSDEGSMTLHELTVLCTNLSNKVESLETELKQTKQTYSAAFTKFIKNVKKLEQTVKTSQARRRTKIIASDDEEDLVVEDPFKQGRSMIEEMDLDAGISLVPPHVELEAQRLKRAGKEVLEEPVKRQKIGEASGSGEESAEQEKELSEDKLQKLLVIVLVEEVYVEALQDLVKERFSTTEPTDDKEKELWVKLKRLFEPDNDDTLWKLQRYMHDPLPLPSVVSRVPHAIAPILVDTTGTPSSTLKIKMHHLLFNNDPIINIFTLETCFEESSSRDVIISNLHQNNQLFDHLKKWTKDHPLDNVIENPSRHVSTRCQLQTDAMWCYFDVFLTKVEPKNFKEAMKESSWIEAMQEEIHEFDRL
ncbi:hypothetical protein Tco_0767983, partial [Tanacetum coccineum]